MANPIKTSDIIIDDGTIDRLLAKLEQFSKAYSDMMNSIKGDAAKLEASLKGVNTATDKGSEQNIAAAKTAGQLSAAYKGYQNALDENAEKVHELRLATQTLNQLKKNEVKFNLAAEGSYNKLAAQYAIIKLNLNAMSKAEREGTEEGRKLEAQSKAIYTEMKRLQEATGSNVLNVGNYKDALSGLSEQIMELPGAFGAAGKGVDELKEKFTALIKNPIVLIIGLISAALVTLFQAFQRSEKGAQFMAKAAGALEGIMSGLVKVVDSLIDYFIEFSEDPVKSIKELGQAIIENIINRVKGAINLVGSFGKALGRLVTGDLAGAEQAMKDAGTAAIQFQSGLDEKQQKQFAAALKEVTNEAIRQAEAFSSLEDAKRMTAKANRELIKSSEKLQTIEAVNAAIADDSTRSFQEREAASIKSQAALEERARKEIQIAKNSLAIISQELNLRRANGEDVEGLLDKQLDGYQAVQSAEREYTLAVMDNQRLRREIQRDDFEQELDYAIDLYDARKRLLERQMKEEGASFDAKVSAYQRILELDKSSFEQQIQLVEEYAGKKIAINELALIDDEKIVRERLKQYQLDEITTNRILEILKERAAATQDIAEIEQQLFKERKAQGKTVGALAGFDLSKDAEKRTLDKVKRIAQSIAVQTQITMQEEAAKDGSFSIYDLMGLDKEGKEREALKTSFDFAKEQLSDFLDYRVQVANQLVQASERSVSAAENELNRQIELQAAGLANKAQGARDELAMAKRNQEKALEEQRKAQKAQQLAQTVEQAANMFTASTKIWAQLGFPLAVPVLGIMWGSFIASKVRAANLSKKQFARGGTELLDGGSHASGNDIPLGISSDGKERRAEGGERLAIFAKRPTRQMGGDLVSIINSINAGNFYDTYQRRATASPDLVALSGGSVDTSRMEGSLERMESHGRVKWYNDSKGRLVRQYRGVTTTYE